MFRLNLKETYQELKAKIQGFFKDSMAAISVCSFSDENSECDLDFNVAVETLYNGANSIMENGKLDEDSDWQVHRKKKWCVSEVSRFLSFDNMSEAQTYLPPTYGIENDYFYNYLNIFFYSLLLIEPDIEARFEVGYKLDQNKVEVGTAGYSEKLQRELPYYLTYLTKKLVVVNPITGQVETISFKKDITQLSVVDNGIYVDGEWVGKVVDGGLEFVVKYDEVQRDFKEAERAAKRESGKKAKETCWKTINLGTYNRSNKNIRAHSLVALMVYGIEVMKFALMEANSPLTIDHIDSVHDNNAIDNLALLTRTHNCSKGCKTDGKGFYIDYFNYLSGGSLV